jgi:hypothetical protein
MSEVRALMTGIRPHSAENLIEAAFHQLCFWFTSTLMAASEEVRAL